MSISGIGFALHGNSGANFADVHHLQHLARTVLVVGANIAAFGILWLLKFLVLNRLFVEIADVEVGEAKREFSRIRVELTHRVNVSRCAGAKDGLAG